MDSTPSTEQPKRKSLIGGRKKQQINETRLIHGTGLTKKAIAKQVTELKHRDDALNIAEAEAAERAAVERAKETEALSETAEFRAKLHVFAAKERKDIEWDQYQLAAIEGLPHEKYGIIMGSAGTGKTTLEGYMIDTLIGGCSEISFNDTQPPGKQTAEWEDLIVPSVAMIAFTGRAVQQTKKNLRQELQMLAMTAHKCLGYMPFEEQYIDEKGVPKTKIVFRPTFNATRKLPYDIIFIDEASMFPIPLWEQLLEATREHTRFYMVGDINQLPPVQGRSVFGFALQKWPTFALEHIHRQAADNPIIANAHRVLRGEMPQLDSKAFQMIKLPTGPVDASTKVIKITEQAAKVGVFDPFRDALIMPQNKGALGQEYINEILMTKFNPPKKDDATGEVINPRIDIKTGRGKALFAVGDKVMITRNDNERMLTNGMVGIVQEIQRNGTYTGTHHQDMQKVDDTIENIDFDNIDFDAEIAAFEEEEEKEEENKRQASHIMNVEFENGVEMLFSTSGQYATVQLAYGFTGHKTQGGEYPTVIIVCHHANSVMLCREWLYTVLTRGAERVILLYTERGLHAALRTQRIKGKNVAEKAEYFNKLQDKAETIVPTLPQPERLF